MKSTLLTILSLVAGLSAFGQVNPIQLGVQLSPTFSYMNTDNNLIESDGSKLGLKLGLIAEYYFQDNYSIHSGINVHFGAGGKLRYDTRFTNVEVWRGSLDDALGTNSPTSQELSGSTLDYSLQFVEIPLGITLRTREFGYVRYFVRPLVALGIMSGSKGSLSDVRNVDDGENFKINSETNPVNISWGIGGGVEYAISTQSSLIGGIGFQSGFLDLTKDKGTNLVRSDRPGVTNEDNSKGRMNSITIMLGVMF